ncbi:MAG: hypothetical protein HY298_17235 [Verrucomicrobia bacterium]|nr:hypothetical protein [Verrucomicrobiota bacterium]
MTRLSFNKKPTFLWQGLLIVLPVVVLAAVGIFSLRQDKILAQHEATERAQAIADDLLPKIWTALTATNDSNLFKHHAFQIDQTGELIFPRPFDPIPRPLSSTELPSDNSQAIAKYNDAVLLARQGKFQEAANTFKIVVDKFPDAIGDTGLELGPLAQWKLLELQNLETNRSVLNSPSTADSFWSSAIYHPTPLTPYFLQLVSEDDRNVQEIWQRLWEEHELSRALYSAAREHLGVTTSPKPPLLTIQGKEAELKSATVAAASIVIPRLFWFQHWLAVRYDGIPSEAADRTGLTAREAKRQVNSGFDSSLIGSKNIITRENRMSLDAAGTPRAVTLDNQEAVLSKTPAKPIFPKKSKGRNIPDLEVVEGPTSSESDSRSAMPTNFWFVYRAESELGSQVTALVKATQI